MDRVAFVDTEDDTEDDTEHQGSDELWPDIPRLIFRWKKGELLLSFCANVS
jgi:hypothetical protein